MKHAFVLAGVLSVILQVSAAADPFTPPNFPWPQFREAKFNVRDFGAKGDGVANDTPAINRAIAECNASGGGDVIFPAGT